MNHQIKQELKATKQLGSVEASDKIHFAISVPETHIEKTSTIKDKTKSH
jgi:hypothetical protein